jgi:tetratricopeptide (TPR) repeat protein
MYAGVSLRQKITPIIVGVFLAVVLLEAGLRVAGFVSVSIQEHRNLRSAKQKGAYRILCLGESTTARQYPPFLEEILNKRNTGIQFSVIDKGVVAINTSTILNNLNDNLNTYSPDMVITMMGMNEQQVAYYKDIPFARTKLFQHLRAYRFLLLLYNRLSEKLSASTRSRPQQSRLIQAEEGFKRAIALDPAKAHIYVDLGKLYAQKGSFSQAEDALRKAIDLAPQDDSAYLALGDVYKREGKLSEAADVFQKAVELNPRSDRAYIELGWAYQSEDAFKKAIELDPGSAKAYFCLGKFYAQKGSFSQAEGALKKALELAPQNDQPWIELAWVYAKEGKYLQAEDTFKQAIKLRPQRDLFYGALSALYEDMGESALAREYGRKADRIRLNQYNLVTVNHYRILKETLVARGIRLVCMQYPMRSIESLKQIFAGNEGGVIFIDNAKIFKDAVAHDGYDVYFKDMFAGDFGHCTEKGNRLLAENIANTILREVFGK